MTCNTIKKRAADDTDHVIDFTDWMRQGDTITAADPISYLPCSAVIEGSTVRLWISGGQAGTAYQVKLKIVTKQSRIKNECIKVRVK